MYKANSVQIRVWRLHRLDAWEAELMRPILAGVGSRRRSFAVLVNHLGNGWLFAAIGLLMPLLAGATGWRFVRVSAIALAVAFSAYLFLKRLIARVRPCHADASLDAHVAPLDLYSCPSGHVMTAAVLTVVLSIISSVAVLPGIGILALIGWSRVALGHHYPSDVIVGAWIGIAVALPLSMWLL
jgi:undecaprenyl-diphosphatase